MPGLPGEKTEVDREGHKMSRNQERRLPTELLIAIGDQLRSNGDIVAFGLTCSDMYLLLVKKQRRSLTIDIDGSRTACSCTTTPTYRLLNPWSAMLKLPGVGYSLDDDGVTLRSCRRCDIAKKMVAAKLLVSQNNCSLAKSIKELTLSGCFPYKVARGWSLPSHPFMGSAGFKAIRPETFKVDLGWGDWNIDVLHGMSVTNLKVLKLPIRLPSDCVRLGQALTVMPKLESLAITDIPDREEFLSELEHIGKAIMSRASTLRELDIEMTNFNRPAPWARDEAFIESEDNGFFFRKFFPWTTKEEIFASCKRHTGHDTNPTDEAPLGLRKLRLKHVTLPSYSFGIILNATTIKHLHLPYSLADEQVWALLKTYARLESLKDISYGMLSARFLDFLAEQSSLKEITFARPQDRYEARGIRLYGDSPYMTISISEEVPRLGPDTGVKYPTLENFLSSLENMTMLKHLVLPVDMYKITRGCLSFIAASLTGLEHLELGFDYEDPELQQVFASSCLCRSSTLKKITFLPSKLLDFGRTHFSAFIASLRDNVPVNLKLVRYMPLDPQGDVEVYYHRETPVHGEWWLCLPPNEGEEKFAEGRTPRIVPVGKWDWETEAERNL